MIRDTNRRPGVCYAVADSGLELPVVDVEHPAFAFEPSAEELEAVTAASLVGLERARRVPAFLQRLAARNSILMRATLEAAGRPLDGMATYLLKLGPENLGGGYASDLDRQLAGTVGAVATRLRLRDCARLLAAGVGPLLEAQAGAPLHLIDIAGGTAIAALNAILLLHRKEPDPLAGRETHLHVLDLDAEPMHFATRALAAWQAADGPLAGVAVTLEPRPYDWREPEALGGFMRSLPEGSLVASSSEGGLFEYGSDAEIVTHLRILRSSTPAARLLVGSTMRDVEMARAVHAASRMPLRLFGQESVAALLEAAGWVPEVWLEGNPLYDVFCVRPG